MICLHYSYLKIIHFWQKKLNQLKEIKASIQIEKIRKNDVMNKVLDKISHSKKTSKVEEIQNIKKFLIFNVLCSNIRFKR